MCDFFTNCAWFGPPDWPPVAPDGTTDCAWFGPPTGPPVELGVCAKAEPATLIAKIAAIVPVSII